MKLRLDRLLFERGLAPSRERAQSLILAGKVLVDGQKIEKSGAAVDAAVEIRLVGDDLKYVSRGGLKLERALENWALDVRGATCLDVGTSTGGFTDCLLQRGAALVIAIDTGYGQIDLRLRNDPRVRLLERTNARYLRGEQLAPFLADASPIRLLAMDVSFISATLVLPAVLNAVRSAGPHAPPAALEAVILVKPQFEVGRGQVGKGGIVRDPAAQQSAVDKVRAAAGENGAATTDVIESPILGGEGNREFLLYARFD